MAVSNVDLPMVCNRNDVRNINFYLLQRLAQSEDYDLLAYEAQRIVDEVLSQSLLYIREIIISDENENKNHRNRFIELENNQWQRESIVKWPTIAEFTDENVGLEKINEYIEKVNENIYKQIIIILNFFKEWKTTPGGQDVCWLYAIDFIQKKSLEFNDLYIYRVRYSIPTRRQPIPRQTVSIYFTLDISKVKPKVNN